MSTKAGILISLLLASVQAQRIPANVRELYDEIVERGSCERPLQTGFYDMVNSDDDSFVYCGDHLSDYGIIYLQGANGKLANMDIDCDGRVDRNDDGRCNNAQVQSETAMQRFVADLDNGVPDLNPFVHDYVVFGNTGDKPGWVTFEPRDYGMEPLSVMAVVCNDKLIYGIWGDTNGDDGANPRIGEASISLATLCFGTDVDGEVGYDNEDVLYIGFVGSDAVPERAANWVAENENEFESSIRELGDRLVSQIG
ncbi:glycoside hydrolase family 75 protein [Hypomontagnella monticulosa]|nr:glycoside hydrolase family 75 protein [Hypomontagnella monticulosa]